MAKSAAERLGSPADMAQKIVDGASRSGDAWKNGVLSPKRDAIDAAIAAESRYATNVQQAITEKRFSQGLKGVDRAALAAQIAAAGGQAYVQGVTSRKDKIGAALATYLPLLAGHMTTIDALPKTTDGDNENRVLQNLRGMRGLKGKYRAAKARG